MGPRPWSRPSRSCSSRPPGSWCRSPPGSAPAAIPTWPMSSDGDSGPSGNQLLDLRRNTMPQRDTAPLGAPCWVDVMTPDPDKTRAFYAELFDWKIDDPGPDYG